MLIVFKILQVFFLYKCNCDEKNADHYPMLMNKLLFAAEIYGRFTCWFLHLVKCNRKWWKQLFLKQQTMHTLFLFLCEDFFFSHLNITLIFQRRKLKSIWSYKSISFKCKWKRYAWMPLHGFTQLMPVWL